MNEHEKPTTAVAQHRRRLKSPEDALTDVQQILRPTINEIRGLRHDLCRRVVEGYHKIGRILLRDDTLLRQAETKLTTYRIKTSSLKTVSEAAGIDESTLSKCRAFATQYEESDIDDLLSPSMTWSHIRHLVTVNTEKCRQELIEQVRAEKLTADELSSEILRRFGNRKPGAGRKPDRPATSTRGISKLSDWIEKSESRILGGLFGEQYDLVSTILMEPIDKRTKEKRDGLVGAATHMREMAASLQLHAQRMEEAVSQIDQRLAAQEQQQEDERQQGVQARDVITLPVRKSGGRR